MTSRTVSEMLRDWIAPRSCRTFFVSSRGFVLVDAARVVGHENHEGKVTLIGTYDSDPANINFPGMNVTDMVMERVIGCKLKWKTRDDKEILMLLGRDLLQYFLFVYDGPSSDVTLR